MQASFHTAGFTKLYASKLGKSESCSERCGWQALGAKGALTTLFIASLFSSTSLNMPYWSPPLIKEASIFNCVNTLPNATLPAIHQSWEGLLRLNLQQLVNEPGRRTFPAAHSVLPAPNPIQNTLREQLYIITSHPGKATRH